MSVNSKMKAIADKIRAKTGKTSTLTLDAMATAVDEVYEKGVEAGQALAPTPLFDMPLPQYCCYVATGKANPGSTTANVTLEFNAAYQMTADETTRTVWVVGLAFADGTMAKDRLHATAAATNVPTASGGAVHERHQYFDTSTPSRLTNGSTTLNKLTFVMTANAEANVVIFYCDKTKYEAEPTAYPQKVDITEMCSIAAGTLTNV